MKRRHLLIALFTAIVMTAAILAAQVRVDVRLVNVIATVTDLRGHYITNLSSSNFLVEEDGKSQEISHFTQDHDVPVSVGILLDTSGSMERKIRTAVEAVDRFIRRIHADDEIFLITFSGEPTLRQDFTADREKLSQSLRRITASGGTALYDSLTEGFGKLRGGRHAKRVILVITDGQDTASVAHLSNVVQTIRESEMLVYPIGISALTYARGLDQNPFSFPMPALVSSRLTSQGKIDEVDINVLHTLAENSGGRAFLLAESLINHGSQIEKVLDTIADELRSQYTLGYYPAHPDDGMYHSIRIRTKDGENVRARRGYVAKSS